MILVELLFKLFVEIIFEGIILGILNLLWKGIATIYDWIFGIKKRGNPIKMLEKKYLYKNIELTEDLNPKLRTGSNGTVLEVINRAKVFAEFYDQNGKQIEYKGAQVFEVQMKRFRLKTS